MESPAVHVVLAALALSPFASAQVCSGPVYSAPIGVNYVSASGGSLWGAGYSIDLGGYRVAQFDGVDWTVIDGVFDNEVLALEHTSLGLVAGGRFTSVDGQPRARVAVFDGVSWQALDTGVDGGPGVHVRAIAEHNGELFVGGTFDTAGGVASTNVAAFDGSQWSTLAGGVDGAVHDFASFGGALIVAGEFANAGSAALPSVASWSGAAWSAVGTTSLSPVTDLAVDGANLYAADGELHVYSGVDWQVNSPPTTEFSVENVAASNGELLVHGPGSGLCVGNHFDPCLTRWYSNGGPWTQLPTDYDFPNTHSLSLATFQGAVYETGDTVGTRAWSNTPKLQWWTPKSAPWYDDTTIQLNCTCLDPMAPVTVQFGAQPPLVGTIVGPNLVEVTLPAGHMDRTGHTSLRVEQNGHVIHVVDGFAIRPFLEVATSNFIYHSVLLRVKSASPAGTAWFVWGAGVTTPYPVPGLFGLGELDLSSYGILGTGALHIDQQLAPTLQLFAPWGTLPPGIVFPVQAVVAEFATSGVFVAITNHGIVAFP